MSTMSGKVLMIKCDITKHSRVKCVNIELYSPCVTDSVTAGQQNRLKQ